MSDDRNPDVLAAGPARSRDGRDENPEKSRQECEAFFAAIEEAEQREEAA